MQNQPNIVIIGQGQLGSAFQRLLGERAIMLTRQQLDLAQAGYAQMLAVLQPYQPDVVINCAAYIKVDKAQEERELCMQVNAHAVGYLAKACHSLGALLVHYSTDYVFNGQGDIPWTEADATSPINHYGASKRAGELAIEASGAAHLIFRISWVYDETGQNFLNTMLRLGAQREELSVVADQIGAPCYAADIATATMAILNGYQGRLSELPSGIYHMAHGGEVSWHGFAEAIFRLAAAQGIELAVKQLHAIPSSAYPTPAPRPHNSRLNCTKLSQILHCQLPPWHDGLTRCMENRNAH